MCIQWNITQTLKRMKASHCNNMNKQRGYYAKRDKPVSKGKVYMTSLIGGL